jgi:hypothetical protein
MLFAVSCNSKHSVDLKPELEGPKSQISPEKECDYSLVKSSNAKIIISIKGAKIRICDDTNSTVARHLSSIVKEQMVVMGDESVLLGFSVSNLSGFRAELVDLSVQSIAWQEFSRTGQSNPPNQYHKIISTLFIDSEAFELMENSFSSHNLELLMHDIEVIDLNSIDVRESNCELVISESNCRYLKSKEFETLAVISNAMIWLQVSSKKI